MRVAQLKPCKLWATALISSNVKNQHAASALADCWFTRNPHNLLKKATQDPQALGTFRGRFHRLQPVKFSPTHTTLAQPCHIIGRQQGLRRDESKQHKVSKCQNIDKEILFKIAYCTPNKMARVVDGGFAYGKIRKD